MLPIFLVQLGVPLLLAAWMLRNPARSAVTIGLQVAGSMLCLLATARIGVWLFPPWWTPWLAGIVILGGAIRTLWRPDRLTVWPTGAPAIVVSIWWVILAMVSTWWLLPALHGRHPPATEITVDLATPVRDGHFLVVNGGSTLQINAHRASADTTIARLQPWRGNGYAVDLVALNGWGLRASGVLPRDPARYVSFGVSVVSPCDGVVVASVDGLSDMPVPEWDREHMAGNHVLLACVQAHVLLGHLKRGSVVVRVGDRVQVGDAIGAIGNSGGSDEPHLHIHAQRAGPAHAPLAGDPLPIRLDGKYLVRGQRIR